MKSEELCDSCIRNSLNVYTDLPLFLYSTSSLKSIKTTNRFKWNILIVNETHSSIEIVKGSVFELMKYSKSCASFEDLTPATTVVILVLSLVKH